MHPDSHLRLHPSAAVRLGGIARRRWLDRDSRGDRVRRLRIVIVDNEGSEQARGLCDRFRCAADIAIRYIHEPRRGISYARNRCLDEVAADCDFIAMIDDDEIPDPDWLEQLLEAQEHSGADVVEGRVVPGVPRRRARLDRAGAPFRLASRPEQRAQPGTEGLSGARRSQNQQRADQMRGGARAGLTIRSALRPLRRRRRRVLSSHSRCGLSDRLCAGCAGAET